MSERSVDSSGSGTRSPGPYGGYRSTHQLQEAAESSLVANGTINELVNHALGYLENVSLL
jgi:hypothetical protein